MSKRLTAPLTTIMIMQGNTIPDRSEVAEIKKTISADREMLLKQQAALVQDRHASRGNNKGNEASVYEGSLQLAERHPSSRAWLHTQQRRIQRCLSHSLQ